MQFIVEVCVAIYVSAFPFSPGSEFKVKFVGIHNLFLGIPKFFYLMMLVLLDLEKFQDFFLYLILRLYSVSGGLNRSISSHRSNLMCGFY